MPIRVKYDDGWCTIRPTPLISIATQVLKNSAGLSFGVTYNITLTGSLLVDQGSPYGMSFNEIRYPFCDPEPNPAPTFVGPYLLFDDNTSHVSGKKPAKQQVPQEESLASLFSKQKALRGLFALDGRLVEISDWSDNGAIIYCMPRLLNIDFQEGIYIDRCDYTITLECDTLYRNNFNIDLEGKLIQSQLRDGDISLQQSPDADNNSIPSQFNLVEISDKDLITEKLGVYLQDFNEEWALETQEEAENNQLNRTYRITHTINATGKTHYYLNEANVDSNPKVLTAYESAKRFVIDKLRISPITSYSANNFPFHPESLGYPNLPFTPSQTADQKSPPYISTDTLPNFMGVTAEATLNLVDEYKGFNHIRSEQSNVNNGTFSVTETWILAKKPYFEKYNISIESSSDNPFVSVNIDGNIRGLSELTANAAQYGGTNNSVPENSGKLTGYENALIRYNALSNNGQFGVGCDIYKRASNVVAATLNSQPLSVSIASNESTSEITYNIRFNNRPTNTITGAIVENITVNDTYPGDVFAVIPVIGRKLGPVLQYIGGRTEYKRDLQINLVMDYTKVAYGPYRSSFMLQKPSVIEPTASQIFSLIEQFSPSKEPGIRKYFVSPPQETWNPKEGSYSLSINWTYELDK